MAPITFTNATLLTVGSLTTVQEAGLAATTSNGLTTGGAPVALTAPGVASTAAGTITTTATANSGAASGSVNITATGTGAVDLLGAIVAAGASNNAGAGSAGGNVAITTNNGAIAVSGVTTAGGSATAGNNSGGNAGTLALNVGGVNSLTLRGAFGLNGGSGFGSGNGGAGQSMTFTFPVLIGGNAALDTRGGPGAAPGVAGNVVFGNTVNADNSATANRSLIVTSGTGTVTFSGDVGQGTNGALADLDVTAGSILFNRGSAQTINVSDQGGNTIVFSGPVTLGQSLVVNTTGNAVTFGSTIRADAAANNRALAVTAGSGAVTFSGDVGQTTNGALADFDATGGAILFNAPAAQTLNASAGPGGSTVTFSGPLTLGQNLTIITDGANDNNVTFGSTINADLAANNRTLNVNAGSATVTFSGGIGNLQALADLDVTAGPNTIVFNAPQAQTLNVTAGGGNTVTLNGPVLLSQSLAVNTGGGTANSVIFAGPVNADSSDNNRTLNVAAGAGSVSLQQVGTTGELGGLTVGANQATLNGNISVTGGGAVDFQNVAGVVLTAPIVIDTDKAGGSTAAGNILFSPTTTIRAAQPGAALMLNVAADGGAPSATITRGAVDSSVPLVEVGQVVIVRPTTATFDSPLRVVQDERAATEEKLDEEEDRRRPVLRVAPGAGGTAAAGTLVTSPPTCTGSATDLTCQ